MKQLRVKLKSESGASITYALLLFLVCAVLSSIILIAATIAGGRISGLAEADQRYYSVTSAAELVKNVISDETVITVVSLEDQTEPLTFNKELASITQDDIQSKISSPGTASVMENIALSIYKENPGEKTLMLSFDENPPDAEMDAVIKCSWDPNGVVNMIVSNYVGSKHFRVNMQFRANIEESDHNRYPDESIMEEENIITSAKQYKWSLVSMTTTE